MDGARPAWVTTDPAMPNRVFYRSSRTNELTKFSWFRSRCDGAVRMWLTTLSIICCGSSSAAESPNVAETPNVVNYEASIYEAEFEMKMTIVSPTSASL